MKKLHLLKTVFLLCALVVGSMNGWAATVTVFSEDFEGGALPSGWSSDTKGGGETTGASQIQSSDAHGGSKCWKLGTNSNPYGSITTCALGFTGNATLTVWARGKSGKTPKLILTVTGCTISPTTEVTIDGSTYTKYTYTLSSVTAAATITFKHNGPSDAGSYIYIDDIEIKQESAGETATVTFADDTPSVLVGNTYTNTPTKTPAALAVTFASDKTDIATVDENTGEVTGVTPGKARITASWAAQTVSTTDYVAGSTSYDITVKGLIVDGEFNFTAYQDYGSGAVPGTSPNTTATTWTAGNVTMDVAGRNVWQNSTSLRLYKANGTDAAGSVTFAAPAGYFITRIVFSGTRAGNLTANNGAMTGTTWTGKSNSVTLTHGGDDAIYLNTATVYYTNAETVSITMGEAGYMTYRYLNANLSFGDGVEAYVASAVGGDNVTLTKVSAAPAGTPLVLKATAGAHNLTIAESAAAVGTNNLKVSNGTSAKGDDVYVLAKPAGKSVGFYKWASATSLSAGKIYLKLPSSSARESLDINFEDDVTAIESVAETWKIDGQYFDLQGRKVSQPTKGLYIVNGKKVILK